MGPTFITRYNESKLHPPDSHRYAFSFSFKKKNIIIGFHTTKRRHKTPLKQLSFFCPLQLDIIFDIITPLLSVFRVIESV